MPKKLDHTAACEHLSRVDRQLARIIARSGPCRLQQETTQSIFAALLESIIYQQLNGKVAATITARVKALFPENTKRIRTRRGLVDGFPTPEQILAASEERLRSAGLVARQDAGHSRSRCQDARRHGAHGQAGAPHER